MILFCSCLMLFLLIFFLVALYHFYVWNFGSFSSLGVRSWVSMFECGFLSQRLVENYFSYTYFLLLVFFVVFDLEISLLLNVPYQGLLYKNFLFYFAFVFLLGLGFSVEISKGYVNWSY
uniref:NADH dehydrogenase subunit 3 n=1 Tax=Plagiorchis elegans TaxID=99610 RepID=UPI0023AA3140|nr:NADH dehydrogenase subunit 3 [Plagiorchis elegans]WCO87339.1 NADH dehydrogenase subunit 3 [Plagiorchis elegans]